MRLGWNAAAYQILNPGMRLWFAADGDAVAGFTSYRNTWVVAGAPVCTHDRLASVASELQHDAATRGCRLVYFGAGARLERLLGADGRHHLLRLGAQPSWDPRQWHDVVRHKATLRAQLNRARNKGVRPFEWGAATVAARLSELRAVLDEWLHRRGLPPLHFMTEPDTLYDLRDRRVFVAEQHGQVVAFLVATPIPARTGWLVEQWPRRSDAVNGTTHLLVDSAMRAFSASHAAFATLGLAPLSDRAGPIGEGEPVWIRMVLRWIAAHGKRFYNFRGLDAFKASLQPMEWEPVYAIVPAPRATRPMLVAVAAAFGGGNPAGFLARAAGHALRREVSGVRSPNEKSHG